MLFVNIWVLVFFLLVVGDVFICYFGVIFLVVMLVLKEKFGILDEQLEMVNCQVVIFFVEDDIGYWIIIEDLLEVICSFEVGMR